MNVNTTFLVYMRKHTANLHKRWWITTAVRVLDSLTIKR